jgi:hypothetical protein
MKHGEDHKRAETEEEKSEKTAQEVKAFLERLKISLFGGFALVVPMAGHDSTLYTPCCFANHLGLRFRGRCHPRILDEVCGFQ